MSSTKEKEGKMKEIVRKTISVSKELEALVEEHETILSTINNPPESNGKCVCMHNF